MDYYPSGCGVFGILRKGNSPPVKGDLVLKAIRRARHRGSKLGAGFAVFRLGESSGVYVLKAFHEDEDKVRRMLEDNGLTVLSVTRESQLGDLCSCVIEVASKEAVEVKKAIRNVNELLWYRREGRIYSAGSGINVFKGVGYPEDVASQYNVESHKGDMWLAHTRQPTNSPGYLPYWSHPFSSFNVAIIHNGDVSSFGANVEFLLSRGWRGFVGTDSEVMAFLFEELVNEGLSVEEAVRVMTNPSTRFSDQELQHYKGARLDGPFTAIIGYTSGDDLYLIAMADRSKFRPVVVGEDEDYYYAASEEAQIRELSPNARVWTLRPGSYMIASLKRGILSLGRPEEEVRSFSPPPVFSVGEFDIDARGMDYWNLNRAILETLKVKDRVRVVNVNGTRFIGNNLPRHGIKGKIIEIYGVAGNSTANLNDGNIFHIHGNVQDDCGDTMHSGEIVVEGDARDVLGQTLQGGRIVVRGNAGNRVGIQMREYRDRRPYLVIGGIVDDYLGEYMAGGVILVLNSRGVKEPVGNFVGTGMVGGRIYVRGQVPLSRVGLQPPRDQTVRFLKALLLEGFIGQGEFETLRDRPYLEVMDKLEGEAKRYAKKLFEEKVGIPAVEYRELTEEELKELSEPLRSLPTEYWELLKEKFTVVSARRR